MSDPLKVAVGGINAASARVATSAQKIATASVPEANVDIAAESVSIMVAKNEHAANAAVVKAVNKMNNTLLDVIA
ncbi:MAG: flagellar basal body rod C-terminal domain-containing protein [Bdellovibrionales bacterium]